jgi:carotenoid 1,2-hydratase
LAPPSLVNRGFTANDAAVLTQPIESAARTLPLYDRSPPDADGWHAVRSPGGYEWWYFDAEDDSGQLRLVAGLCEGFVFHPGYLRRYYQYLADPTRHEPPLPGEYPCAWFAVFEGGRVLAQYVTQVRPEDFAASADGPDVSVGPNQLNRDPDGSLRLQMSRGPLSGDVVFQPSSDELARIAIGEHGTLVPSPGTPGEGEGEGLLLPSSKVTRQNAPHPNPLPEYREREKTADVVRQRSTLERDFLSRKMTGADHRWVIANPLYRAQGEVYLDGRVIAFAGRGYHDHNFGSAPLGPGLRRWIRGRMLWDDGMFAFHYARPHRRRLGDEVSLVLGDARGLREVPVTLAKTDWSGRTALAVRYPTSLHLNTMDGEAGEIRLEAARVVQATAFQVRLTYEARFGQRTGQAFCEVGYPCRLTWPVVGRMIEKSIEKP